MSDYNYHDYNCPDCNEAKLQSDKNARKINEVIDQVNALIQVNNETVDFIEEKSSEVIEELAEVKVNEELGDIILSLDNLENEVNELKEGNIQIDLTDYATKDYVDDAINNAKLEGGNGQVDLSSYAKKTDLHDHSNKTILDSITTSKVNQWDDKADKSTLTAHTNDTTIHITEAERNRWNNNTGGSVNNELIEEKINEVLGKVLEENLDEEISNVIVENMSDALRGSVRVNNVFSNGQTLNSGYLSIVDDDNAIQVWDILKPMSEELNIPFCVAVPSNDVKVATGGSMTKEQLKYLQDNLKWEICGHTVTHTQLGSLSYEQQLIELRDNKALLTSYGLDVRGLAYPFGGYNNDTLEIMPQYYDYGFNGGQQYKYNTVDTFENYMIYRIAFGSYEPDNSNNGDLQYYKDKIDEVISNNGWLVLMTHISDKNHTAEDTEKLRQLIQYAKDRNVNISTPNKIFDKFKNLIEVPNRLKITNNGSINEIANKEKVNIINDDTKVATDLLTSFKENTITYTRAFKSTTGNGNLPDNGTLETVNIGPLTGATNGIKDYTFRHQKLYGLNGGIWYRQTTTYNNWSWGEWKSLLGGGTSSGSTSGSTNIITELVTIPASQIPGNSCMRFGIELVNKNQITADTAILLRPRGGIEDNITYSVDIWGTNNFGIKLYNVNKSQWNVAERTWIVKIIN